MRAVPRARVAIGLHLRIKGRMGMRHCRLFCLGKKLIINQ